MKKMKKKYIAIQNGCDNIINVDDEPICDTITEAKSMVELAIKGYEDCCGDRDHANYDEDKGDVIVYELIAIGKAKTNGVTWEKL